MFLQQSEWTLTMMERSVGCLKIYTMRKITLLLLLNFFFQLLAYSQSYAEFLTDSTDVRVLKGTLLFPGPLKKAIPLVLIIAGSGPTDRNGNGPMIKSDCYKMLAEGLAKEGIASFRYD